MEDTTSVEPAILVRGVSKQYGNEAKVLDNLDMTVIKGTIYGLLGASGCGKTTLLGTILGSRKIQHGSISILGKPSGVVPAKSVGYMPQDIALVGELTIKNVFQHQGWIFGMTDKQIEERHKFCEKLLDLPPANKLIKNLSGGQQRRVSLAVVLIQDPELLILDEPTVGLDPVLRQILWDYLIKITKEDKKTVVITTHYIEEVKQADQVGILRNGKMLIEGEPLTLMSQFNCSSLEDLFIWLSAKQQEGDSNISIHTTLISKADELHILKQPTPKKSLVQKICFTNRGHAKALLSKNFIRYVRHPGTLIITLLIPIIQICALFMAIGRIPGDLKIGIVNQELGEYRNCEDYLNDNHTIGGYRINELGTCVFKGLGCKFTEQIQNVIENQVYFKSIEEALKAIKEVQIHQVLYFPHNYSEAFTIMVNNFSSVDPEEINFGKIVFYRDDIENPLNLHVEKEVLTSYQKFSEALANDCQWRKSSVPPLKLNEPIYGKPDATYADFVAPGVIALVVMSIASALAVTTIVSERNGGIWERTTISGVLPAEILICHIITMSFLSAIQIIECFSLWYYIFGLDCQGNVLYTVLLLYQQSLVGITLGILLSAISRNEAEAAFLGTGTFLPCLALSGCIWPLEGMPTYLKYVGYAIPVTIPIESLNNIIFRGWGISNFNVYKGYLTSLGYIFLFIILSILGFKFEKK